MASLEDKLAELHQQERNILTMIYERNKNRTIEFASCKDYHKIKDLTAIKNHVYIPPQGCTD